MANVKKYYWLKLHKDFFKRHDIRVVEAMDNGKDYILFYMKLLLESVDHEGYLRFSDTIPYNEKTLSIITNTNIDIVRGAIDIFRKLDLMEILDDETIFLTQTQLMLGVETEWAKKKREYRAKQNLLEEDTERTKKDNVRQEIEKEIELDIEIEKDNIKPLSNWEKLFDKFWLDYPKKVNKGNAKKWFKQNKPDELLVNIMIEKVLEYIEKDVWNKENYQYIPYASSWLNAEGWTNEVIKVDKNNNQYKNEQQQQKDELLKFMTQKKHKEIN
jgi:predicted phage replisome organizer